MVTGRKMMACTCTFKVNYECDDDICRDWQ